MAALANERSLHPRRVGLHLLNKALIFPVPLGTPFPCGMSLLIRYIIRILRQILAFV
jgi:hypothetical protein